MRVLLVWPDCRLLNGVWTRNRIDSYWVECTPEEAEQEVLPRTNEVDRRGWWPPAKQDGKVAQRCFLVAKDISSIHEMAYFYPYSGQWGSNCPFRQLPEAVVISRLEELQNVAIPPEFRR